MSRSKFAVKQNVITQDLLMIYYDKISHKWQTGWKKYVKTFYMQKLCTVTQPWEGNSSYRKLIIPGNSVYWQLQFRNAAQLCYTNIFPKSDILFHFSHRENFNLTALCWIILVPLRELLRQAVPDIFSKLFHNAYKEKGKFKRHGLVQVNL